MPIVSHGIDLADVPRIAKMLDEHAAAFLARCFTAAEQAYCGSFKAGAAVHYAGRFAAKEAVMKALGTGWRGQIAWTDMEIVNDANGKPELRLTGESAKIAADRGIRHWHVSITHTEMLAIASVIAES
jgi:holo-[acyl-carrier protein] synthase